MSALQEILNRLDKVKQTGRDRWQARCPAHEDKSPSLSVGAGDDGRVLLKCWAGCGAIDVVQSIGLELSDLFERDDHYQHNPKRPKQLRPNWREIVQLMGHDATVVMLCANKICTTGKLSDNDFECLESAYNSLSKVVNVTEAFDMPKRMAA